jgi:serine/threonine-protein kinase HipA
MSDRELLVYVDLAGSTYHVGRLWARRTRNRESASFKYDAHWLTNPARFALEPALVLGRGPQYTQQGRALFGAFGVPHLTVGAATSFSATSAKRAGRKARTA